MFAWPIAHVALIRSSSRSGRALYCCFEFFEFHWFDQMVGKPFLKAFLDVPVVAKAADGNTWHFGNVLQLRHQFHAASIWQRNITDQKIELIAHRGLHRRAHIVRCCHKMSAADKQFFQSGACVLMVIDEQNSQTLAGSLVAWS